MTATSGRYQVVLRPVPPTREEYVVGECHFTVREGAEEGEVDFYDTRRELEGIMERVCNMPPDSGN